jgi:hypothetical protein
MKKIILLLLVLTPILHSCSKSNIIKKLLTNKHKKLTNKNEKKIIKSENFCPKKTKLELISNNKKSTFYFQWLLKNTIKDNISLNFTDKAILWAMVQSNFRPDLTSPTSQTTILYKNKTDLIDTTITYSKKVTYPFLKSLENIIKTMGTNKSLIKLAMIFDQYFPGKIPIDKDFSYFLQQNKAHILGSKNLSPFYSRGDEILREGETIPKIRMAKLVLQYRKKYRSKLLYKTQSGLYDFNLRSKNFQKSSEGIPLQVFCNYDMKLYDSSIYLIEEEIIKSNTFGIKEKNNYMVFNTTQKIPKKFTNIKTTPYLVGESKTQSPAICHFKNEKLNTWLISDKSRDPGQHLFHIFKYGIENITKVSELDTMLSFSRHLVLRNPLRLIYESQKGSQAQLEQLLKLKIPIYNSSSLGNIWGYFNYKSNSHFIFDKRNTGKISCQ